VSSSYDLRVLQEARRYRSLRQERERQARRARRRRRAKLTGVAVLAVLAVLLVVLVTSASSPSTPQSTASARRTHAPGTARGPRTTRPAYGVTRSRHQITAHFKLPLRSGLLFDVRTGRVLWARNPTERLPIASLTKMMTAIVVATHASANEQVPITRQAVHFSGSGVGMLPLGKTVRLRTLLYGLLLPSGNDAAIALAQHVAGTRSHFIGMMNAEAAQLHLGCTHFSTVSGIVDQGNYSCATDLAVLAHALLEHPLLRQIVASSSAILPFPIKGHKLYLYNNNPLLRAGFPGADGVKTGYTTLAGLCIVATAQRGHQWLGVVLLHSGNWLTQAEQLLNAGFAARG
jgi:D-alanyl-D-alanine carboxypeptidase (penicillin-binding protein 5/6)